MKKFFALLVVLSIVICSFVSCSEPDAKKLLEDAAQAMSETPYTVTMGMSLTTDDTNINEALKAVSTEGVEITVDGENMQFSMDMDFAYAYATASVDYILYEGVIYMDMNITAYGQTTAVKKKANLNSEQYEEFLSEMNVSFDMNPDDFGDVNMEKEDEKYVITCTGYTEALNDVLDDMMSEIYDVIDYDMEISDVGYVAEIENGKLNGTSIFCSYDMNVAGESVEVAMSYEMEYDYENASAVIAPEDAASYEEVDYGSLMD